jgi:CubicO group peptidase (beta-lactamase class C family)
VTSRHPLSAVDGWSTEAAAGYRTARGQSAMSGRSEEVFPWASVTKLVTALAVWVAVEEGITAWDEPAGPAGSTVRHLLAHASGLAPDADDVLSPPGRRRIYSNRGIEVVAAHVAERARFAFADYATEAVLEPLRMRTASIGGSPARDARGSLEDLMALAAELQTPTLIAASTLAEATAPAFPGLSGVLPGFGPQPDNAWGLGVEIRGHKRPHWTGRRNSPRTYGHFGQSGSFLWVDPDAGVAAVSLAARSFGPWATEAWPALSDAILDAMAGSGA